MRVLPKPHSQNQLPDFSAALLVYFLITTNKKKPFFSTIASLSKALLPLSAVPPHTLTFQDVLCSHSLRILATPNVPAICADTEPKITCNLVNYDNYGH